jgi:hypothetical protein
MIGMVRDTWRAVLVVVVAVLLREVFAERPAAAPTAVATPSVATHWQPQVVVMPAPAPAPQERPLRRVVESVIQLGDSVIGVVRR